MATVERILRKLGRVVRGDILPLLGLNTIKLSVADKSLPTTHPVGQIEAFSILFSEGRGGDGMIPEAALRHAAEALGVSLSTFRNVTATILRRSHTFTAVKQAIYDALIFDVRNNAPGELAAFLDFVHYAGWKFEGEVIYHEDYLVCPWNAHARLDDRLALTFGQGNCLVVLFEISQRLELMAHLPVRCVLDPSESALLATCFDALDGVTGPMVLYVANTFAGRAGHIVMQAARARGLDARVMILEKSERETISYRVDNLAAENKIRIFRSPQIGFDVSPIDTGAAMLPYGPFVNAEFVPFAE